MSDQCCIYCTRQEDGKPATVCSRCVQLIINANPEAITAFLSQNQQTLTVEQLHSLQNTTDQEVEYEHKTRKFRKNLGRKRIGRTVKPVYSQIRQVRAA
jgi:hypothetical protein